MHLATVASISYLTVFCLLLSLSPVVTASFDLTGDNGSGDKEDDGNIFVSKPLLGSDDTSDDSPAAAEETELIGGGGGNQVLDDEAEKHQTDAPKEDAKESEDKQPSTEEEGEGDRENNGTDSNGSNKDADEGSGEAEEPNSEAKESTAKELDNEKEKDEDEKDDTANEQKSKGSKWKYHGSYGPGNWSREFSGCTSDLRFQSPINIIPEQTRFDDTRQEITFFMKHSGIPCNSILFNDRQTAKLVFKNMDVHVIGLDRLYKVAEVQFHWGNTNSSGSEHVIAGKRYPLEMQVLCYDEENFPDLADAEGVADNTSFTIFVLATLFELSNEDNRPLSLVTENLKAIQSPGQNISIPSLDLIGLLPKMSDYFYRYSGSLTSPPCQEGTEWIVFHEHQTISPSQLEKFRQLHEEELEDGKYTTIDYNWRPLQPLNGRVVTRSFPLPKKGNPNTQKPISGKLSTSSSHRIPVIDVSVCMLVFTWKLFFG